MKNNVKNVAYIQNLGLLTDEQIQKYMGDIKYSISNDAIEMYKFIVCCNKCYKITNFCINIYSETLKILNILIQNNRKLDDCIFIATFSNANSIRDEITKNIYFSLSSVNVIIEDYLDITPYNIMTIVSDIRNPYFDQIYETGPKPAYRISELTVEKMNEFVDKGNALDLLISLEYLGSNEYEKLNEILLDPACKYKNFATFIELSNRNIQIVNKLNSKLASINNVASNVSINGSIEFYPDLNILYLYNNCSVQLVNNYNSWSNFIKSFIVFNRFSSRIEKSAIKISLKELLTSTIQKSAIKISLNELLTSTIQIRKR